MGLNLAIRTTPFGVPENQTWLGSSRGTQSADPITLDATLCVAIFATGLVPSGIALTKRAGSGNRYSPTLVADTVIDGHLFTTVDMTAGGTQTSVNTPAALMWEGEIIVAKVPAVTGGIDLTLAASQAKSKLIRYV